MGKSVFKYSSSKLDDWSVGEYAFDATEQLVTEEDGDEIGGPQYHGPVAGRVIPEPCRDGEEFHERQ